MHLMFNALFQITSGDLSGLYRFIFDDRTNATVVAVRLDRPAALEQRQIGRKRLEKTRGPRKKASLPLVGSLIRIDGTELARLDDAHQLHKVDLESDSVHLLPIIGERAQALYERRKKAMASFLSVDRLQESIAVHGGLGGLVREAMQVSKLSRAAIYKNWSLLCRYGITEASLRPRHDRCGAPNASRPCDPGGRQKAGRKTTEQRLGSRTGLNLNADQPGMSTAWRAMILAADATIPLPKPRMSERCTRIVGSHFVRRYRQVNGELIALSPDRGDYPNVSQIRRVIETQVPRLQRLLESTTQGHFDRNMRGLSGKNWQGVAGPGHTWAIDSTVGDLYLRSSINRAWIIGRPIVYVMVDTWSTAVVGFFVCLQGPSWSMAKVALFCSGIGADLLASLWGFDTALGLSPAATLPAVLLCDRGEYLSRAASQTGVELLPALSYAPPYRPDYKGIVEVLHRIEKDKQYYFVPGAIDPRRAEYELRRFKPNEAVLTVHEFVQYLYVTFREYNLTANRSHRLDAHMKGSGVFPTPSGLWHWGHAVGIGFQRSIPKAQLISSLLPTGPGRVTRSGVRFAGRDYTAPKIGDRQWTAQARNFGGWDLLAHYFPGAVGSIWTPNVGGVGMLDLHLMDQSTASPELTFDEVTDAHQYSLCRNAEIAHSNLKIKVESLRDKQAIVENAKKLTKMAVSRDGRSPPTLTEAKELEVRAGSALQLHDKLQPAAAPEVKSPEEAEELHNAEMQRILASLNHVGDRHDIA